MHKLLTRKEHTDRDRQTDRQRQRDKERQRGIDKETEEERERERERERVMQTLTETQTDANQYRVISSLHWIRSVCLLGVRGGGGSVSYTHLTLPTNHRV